MEAIRGGWYLGEEGFKDKLLGLIDKAGAKIRKRGSVAGAAVCAHGENEAERIIRIMGGRAGPSQKCGGTGIIAKRRFSQGALRGTGEGPHLGKERLAGQPVTHGSSCGHEPVGEPDPEGSKEPQDSEKA